MENQKFKTIFNNISTNYGFEKKYGSWLKKSEECLIVLELQKSNYGNYYQLNIKVFIQGLFEKSHKLSKDLVKTATPAVLGGELSSHRDIFDLDKKIDDKERVRKLEKAFEEYIIPCTKNMLTKKGIIELYKSKEVFLLPAVKKELGISEI